jgi:hypothetical protein
MWIAVMTLAAMMLQTGTLQFTAPPAWKARAAASSMRVAEFIVPRAPGDSDECEFFI